MNLQEGSIVALKGYNGEWTINSLNVEFKDNDIIAVENDNEYMFILKDYIETIIED